MKNIKIIINITSDINESDETIKGIVDTALFTYNMNGLIENAIYEELQLMEKYEKEVPSIRVKNIEYEVSNG